MSEKTRDRDVYDIRCDPLFLIEENQLQMEAFNSVQRAS